MNLIRSNEIYLESLEEIDDEVETNNDDQNSWFNKENNDNVDGDKTVLENDNWVDPKVNIDHNNFENMHGVVKQEVGEMDRFLGRNPERKPKIRILANDMGKKVPICIHHISFRVFVYYLQNIRFNIKGREDLVIAPFKGRNVAQDYEAVPNDFTENCVAFHQKIKGKTKMLNNISNLILIL